MTSITKIDQVMVAIAYYDEHKLHKDYGMEMVSDTLSSVHFSVVSDSLQPHGLQHTRLLCPSPTLRACSNSCPLSRWCHSTISFSVIPFSCLQSFPASVSFPMSQSFTSGGWSIGASASASAHSAREKMMESGSITESERFYDDPKKNFLYLVVPGFR